MIAVLLNCFPLQQYSELPSLGNMCSPGCVNGLQPYVPRACLTPHLVWRWLAAPAPIPFPSFPFQQPPHSSNCLSIQALPSPTAVHFPCLFPPSASFLFSFLSRCCMGGINLRAANNWKAPSQMDHILKQYLTEVEELFPSLKSQTVKNRSLYACGFFYS